MKIKGSRVITLVLVLVAVLSVFVIRLMRYQLVEGASYRLKSQKVSTSIVSIKAARGQIVDRYGNVLATNRAAYDITFQYDLFPTSSKKNDQENALILNLTKVLKEKNETWNDSLPISVSNSKYSYTDSGSDLKALRALLNVGETISAADAFSELSGKYKISGNGIDDEKRIAGSMKTMSASVDALLKANVKVSASEAFGMLVDRYKISGSYSAEEKRIIAGVRYTMEIMQFSSLNAYTFASDVSTDTVTKISERSAKYPGVEITEDSERDYPSGKIAPHVVGTVGIVSSSEFKNTYTTKNGYTMNDIVGKSGIEKSMESYLKGTDGKERLEVDSSGNIVDQTVTKQPDPGDTVVLTIDSGLQKVLQNALQETVNVIRKKANGNKYLGADAKRGAAVVINRKTGEILAMASLPTFDLSTYEDDKSKLMTDKDAPLLNRAVYGAYRPGSSFKPTVALSALMNGVITKNTTISTRSTFVLGGITFHSENNGRINVVTAIAKSNNFFFYNVGKWTGISKLNATAKMLGLGKKTGVELPNEYAGKLAGPSERTPWNTGDTVQASIGQSDNLFTPLQLASYVATLLNGGTRLQLHIVKQINTYDNSSVVKTFSPNVLSKASISEKILSIVKEGMGQVTENGTATKYFRNYSPRVGGKTGTSQVDGNYYNSVFVSFAPFDDPEIVVAAVVEHGHYGADVALLARRVYDSYFHGTNSTKTVSSQSTLLN